MNNDLALNVSVKNGFLWIKLPDSINMDNYTRIEEQIGMAVADSAIAVVLDLESTHNLFSSGLGLLIRIKKRLDEKNAKLYLVNVSFKIREILGAVHLDKLFTMYATDVEFEISQEELLEKKTLKEKFGFVFVGRIENGVYRIGLSGSCGLGRDLSALTSFTVDGTVHKYVFDLTGLDMVDSGGMHILGKLLVQIHESKAAVAMYGGDQFISDLLDIFGITEFVSLCKDERAALDAIEKAAKLCA